MKKAIAIGTAALGLLLATSASAGVIGFNGPFAPGTWVTTTSGNTGGSNGSAIMSNTTLTLAGGNGASGCPGAQYGLSGPCQISVTTTHIENPFSFHWSYSTADLDGPGGDLFGILVNGTRIQLSDLGGPVSQSGNVTISAGSSFGWYLNCTDCTDGAATATITAFAAPEPGSLALMALGLTTLYGVRRRVR